MFLLYLAKLTDLKSYSDHARLTKKYLSNNSQLSKLPSQILPKTCLWTVLVGVLINATRSFLKENTKFTWFLCWKHSESKCLPHSVLWITERFAKQSRTVPACYICFDSKECSLLTAEEWWKISNELLIETIQLHY